MIFYIATQFFMKTTAQHNALKIAEYNFRLNGNVIPVVNSEILSLIINLVGITIISIIVGIIITAG